MHFVREQPVLAYARTRRIHGPVSGTCARLGWTTHPVNASAVLGHSWSFVAAQTSAHPHLPWCGGDAPVLDITKRAACRVEALRKVFVKKFTRSLPKYPGPTIKEKYSLLAGCESRTHQRIAQDAGSALSSLLLTPAHSCSLSHTLSYSLPLSL